MKLRMMYRYRRAISVLIFVLFLTVAAVLSFGTPANAGEPFEVVLPAGVACDGFDVKIQSFGSNQVTKEFVDKNGNVARFLQAGKGPDLLFTNLSTGATLSLKGNGSVWHVKNRDDGSQTWSVTGHNVIILFPTDNPPGPSSKLYVGHVIYLVDQVGNFDVQQVNGRTTSAPPCPTDRGAITPAGVSKLGSVPAAFCGGDFSPKTGIRGRRCPMRTLPETWGFWTGYRPVIFRT